MTKAYDIAELASILKSNGLVLAEDAAEIVAKSTFEWLDQSADLSENKLDDLLKAVLPLVKPMVFKAIDKIDGAEG